MKKYGTYPISIVYFSLGVGTDYIYKGTTEFRGMNDNDVLHMSHKQIQYLGKNKPYPLDKVKKAICEIFPEYYLIRVNNFNKPVPETPLEEWIYFLGTDEIRQDSKVPGLPEARGKLRYELLDERRRRNTTLTWNKEDMHWASIIRRSSMEKSVDSRKERKGAY